VIVEYTFGTVVSGTMEEVEQAVTSALAQEGFGVLTKINVAATLKAKIGVDRTPYVILGACNPALAHMAIEVDNDLGALLPCNVVLREEGDAVAVRFMDPNTVLGIVGNPEVDVAGVEAGTKLRRVAAALR
jgi:uncharacterized protein (DUF302 family)